MEACGIFFWYPNWMARFANTRCYMIVYGLLGTIQEIGATYLFVTLTTMEKRFKIPSQTTGLILTGNEISQITLALLLTYFGGQKNRPRWIAWGMVFSAISCFILALPHFIYGAGDEALRFTAEYGSKQENASTVVQSKPIDWNYNNNLCKTTDKPPNEVIEILTYLPLILIFISQFLLGISNTLYATLGQTYLDDNNPKQRNTPLMLSLSSSMRMVGPIIGYGYGYLLLLIYIDPSKTPTITQDDPRWLGAWWLGWIILSVITFFCAALIGLFPKYLPHKKQESNIDNYELEKMCEQSAETFDKSDNSNENVDADVNLKNFPKALMRLLKNKILMFHNFASICYMLGSSGFHTFQGRIMEVQFNRSSHAGTIFTGPVSRIGMIGGLLLSGVLITKFKPPAKYIFLWNVIWGFTAVLIRFLYTQIGCDGGNVLLVNGSIFSCNSNCNCDDSSYSPVCDRSTNITYFSACHGGCQTFDENAGIYRDCICTSEMKLPRSVNVHDQNSNDELNSNNHIMLPRSCVDGDCSTDYYIFSFVLMISGFFSMVGAMSSTLIDLRSVEPRDKSFAGGFSMFISSSLALIPGPILFGRMIDSTCLVWSNKNGDRGNCLLYDPIKFRQRLHPYLAMFILFGTIFDILIWYYGRSLELYCDGNKKPKTIVGRKGEREIEPNENESFQR